MRSAVGILWDLHTVPQCATVAHCVGHAENRVGKKPVGFLTPVGRLHVAEQVCGKPVNSNGKLCDANADAVVAYRGTVSWRIPAHLRKALQGSPTPRRLRCLATTHMHNTNRLKAVIEAVTLKLFSL